MTNEEAIALVRAKYNMHCDDTECNNDHCDACCEAFEMAIEALEKADGWKAINPDDETDGHFYFVKGLLTCKKTGKDIRYPLASIGDLDYCPRCGKRLDWSKA